VKLNRYLLRLVVDPYTLTIFPDGRAIIAGTDDIAVARSIYAQCIGT
jgi:adenylyltransferase/sulfurtransferase